MKIIGKCSVICRTHADSWKHWCAFFSPSFSFFFLNVSLCKFLFWKLCTTHRVGFCEYSLLAVLRFFCRYIILQLLFQVFSSSVYMYSAPLFRYLNYLLKSIYYFKIIFIWLYLEHRCVLKKWSFLLPQARNEY